MEPGRRQRVVRHPGVFAAAKSSRSALLPIRPAGPEALRPPFGRVDEAQCRRIAKTMNGRSSHGFKRPTDHDFRSRHPWASSSVGVLREKLPWVKPYLPPPRKTFEVPSPSLFDLGFMSLLPE